MLDRRKREQNGKTIKADRANTLSAQFFDKKPHYVKQEVSSIRGWNPSLHVLRNKHILFASADEVKVDQFATNKYLKDAKKNSLDHIIQGKKVILEVSPLSPPHKSEMLIVTNINGANQITVLADLRDE